MIQNFFINIFVITSSVFFALDAKDNFLNICKKHVDLDNQARKNLTQLSEKVALKYGIQFMTCGLGDMVDYPKSFWCIKYMIQHPTTLEEMRPITQNIYSSIWKNINIDPVFDNFLEAKDYSYDVPKQPLTSDLLTLKIVFWDQDMNRPLKPYLAQVSVKENKIYYYYADPKTQALQDPIIEDLPQEALVVGH